MIIASSSYLNGVRGGSSKERDYSEDSTRDRISDGMALNTKNQYQLSSNKANRKKSGFACRHEHGMAQV